MSIGIITHSFTAYQDEQAVYFREGEQVEILRQTLNLGIQNTIYSVVKINDIMRNQFTLNDRDVEELR